MQLGSRRSGTAFADAGGRQNLTMIQAPGLPVEIVETAQSHNTPVQFGVAAAPPPAE